jgi:5-methyltetrahydropteroyltriglutamate--homocysteine methyltransferase
LLKDRPKNLGVTMHTCRGNHASMWMAEGGYDAVAEAVFQTEVDGFFLEYDTARAGGFEPLRFVPKGKKVVLGLVSTKTPVLESKVLLKKRVEAAAKYVPLENLCLSPQCGFASSEVGNKLTADDQRRKLELVVETAREIWG